MCFSIERETASSPGAKLKILPLKVASLRIEKKSVNSVSLSYMDEVVIRPHNASIIGMAFIRDLELN